MFKYVSLQKVETQSKIIFSDSLSNSRIPIFHKYDVKQSTIEARFEGFRFFCCFYYASRVTYRSFRGEFFYVGVPSFFYSKLPWGTEEDSVQRRINDNHLHRGQSRVISRVRIFASGQDSFCPPSIHRPGSGKQFIPDKQEFQLRYWKEILLETLKKNFYSEPYSNTSSQEFMRNNFHLRP